METVHVIASKTYDVKIGKGLLANAAYEIRSVCPDTTVLAIISDDKVYSLYGNNLEKNLKNSGYNVISFIFRNGEQSKSIDTFAEILNFLGENKVTRSDAIIALGGGVTGDIAGFCASCFLRGIRFIQIPTTLLAMVDSSVGGKTAVNLKSGKNLAGAFYQPELVLCDTDVLGTLSQADFADGVAEIIKYGMIRDKALFDFVKNKNISDNIEYVIRKCIEIKAQTVRLDEFDTGERQLLNFGHTVGHAIEKCGNYDIHHGSAVAVGMIIMSRGAYKCGLCDEDYSNELTEITEKYGLPTSVPYSSQELYNITLSDKKRNGNLTNIIVPTNIGNCTIKKVPSEQLSEIIRKGIQI